MKHLYSLIILIATAVGIACAEEVELFFVGKDTQLYEQPSVKGEVAIAMNGKPVDARKGMFFRIVSTNGVWYKVEYMTGVNAYILGDCSANGQVSILKPGEYTLENADGKVSLSEENGKYILTDATGTRYTGLQLGSALVFRDRYGNVAYTAVNIGNRAYVFNYQSMGW